MRGKNFHNSDHHHCFGVCGKNFHNSDHHGVHCVQADGIYDNTGENTMVALHLPWTLAPLYLKCFQVIASLPTYLSSSP